MFLARTPAHVARARFPFSTRFLATEVVYENSSTDDGSLSASQLQQYSEQGFLVLQNFMHHSWVDRLRQRALQLVDAHRPDSVSVFATTGDNSSHKSDQYFLTSGDRIRCFFEAGAFDSHGNQLVERRLAINKLGHAMHDLDGVFALFSYHPKVCTLGRSMEKAYPHGGSLLNTQAMYIFKQPGIGGEIGAHQDSTFIISEPDSCCAIWFALEDATLSNGCLWGIPGSHKGGVSRRFTKQPDGRCEFDKPETQYAKELFVPLPVNKGDVVIFDGAFVHMSYPNTSPESRHAYTLHLVGSKTVWPERNWLQRAADRPFRALVPENCIPLSVPEGTVS